jgi:hypothetical protein
MKKSMTNISSIDIINQILGYRMSMTKRCQKCSVLIDDDNFRYHADVRRNNMTSCQENLLYESLP